MYKSAIFVTARGVINLFKLKKYVLNIHSFAAQIYTLVIVKIIVFRELNLVVFSRLIA